MPAKRVKRSNLAKADLLAVWGYVAGDSPRAADKLLKEIDKKLALYARKPDIGRRRLELGLDLRSFPHGNYVVSYRPSPDGIEVVRVLSAYQDVSGLSFDA